MKRLRVLSFGALALAVVALGAMFLTSADRAAQAQTPEEELQAAVDSAVAAWNAQDFEAFASHFTAKGLEEFFEIGPDDDAEAILAEEFEFSGPIESAELTNFFITSGNARANADLRFEFGFSVYEEWSFLFLDGEWVINGTKPASRPIPEGVPVVDMFLQEYAFVYNPAAIQAADGNVAFSVTNVGQEPHEVVILAIEGQDSLLDLLQAADPESEDLPPELEFVTFGGFFEPGQKGSVVLDSPLSPGRYGLICFIPAEDGTPHAFLGMVSEFSVGAMAPDGDDDDGAGPITPPSTGDAGLLGSGTGTVTWLLLGLALTAAMGGGAGLVAVRRASGR